MNSHCHNCEDTATYNVELEQEIAALRKVLESCKAAMKYAYEDHVDQYYINVLNIIEQTLSKGKTE